MIVYKAYKYVYYRLYLWNKKLWGEHDVPEFNAVLGMSLSFMCNVGSLVVLIDMITGVQLIPLGLPKINIILPIIAVLLLHYFALMHNGKYREIEKEFKKENKEDRKRKWFWVLLYSFGSMVFFIALLFFGIWIKK